MRYSLSFCRENFSHLPQKERKVHELKSDDKDALMLVVGFIQEHNAAQGPDYYSYDLYDTERADGEGAPIELATSGPLG